MTALLVLICLAATAVETIVADVADAQAIAQTVEQQRAVEVSAPGLESLGGTDIIGAFWTTRSATSNAITGRMAVPSGESVSGVPVADADQRVPLRCDDGGSHCACPCHGPCPCALLDAAAVPTASRPAEWPVPGMTEARLRVRADLAPRSQTREPALRPPIATAAA